MVDDTTGQPDRPPIDVGKASLSHDIRSVMSDLIGGLRLVDLDALDNVTAAHVGRIRTAAGHLARLLEDASLEFLGERLDIPTGDMEIRLTKMVRDLRVRWEDQSLEKGLKFALNVQDGLEDVVLTDRLSIERVLSNLLGNALKFTQSGDITLVIRDFEVRGLSFQISDTGPGFSEAALKQLYRFGGRPETNAQAGTGLGLFIAQQLSDRLGASLDISNNPNGGATATFSIPRVFRTAETAEDRKPGQTLPDLSGISVLVAEDNQTSQLIVTRALEGLGAKCTIVSTGDETTQLLLNQVFDIALVDIEMPNGTGIDAITAFRRQEANSPDTRRKLPIIALTAYVLRANREAIFQAGADEIISKPVTSSEQIAVPVARALNIPVAEGAESPTNLRKSERIKLHALLEMVGSENAEELLSRLRNDLAALRGDLRLSILNGNMANVADQMHILVSISGSVGAVDLQRLAEDLHARAERKDWAQATALAPQLEAGLSQLMALVTSEYRDRFGVT